MVVLPHKKVVVVATPRTGSRTIQEMILRSRTPLVYATREHHSSLQDVSALVVNDGYEVWTVCRHPVAQLESLVNLYAAWDKVEGFLQEWSGKDFFGERRLNIYYSLAKRVFIFEKDGIRELLSSLDLTRLPVKLARVSDAIRFTGKNFTQKQSRLAEQLFPADFTYYYQHAA